MAGDVAEGGGGDFTNVEGTVGLGPSSVTKEIR